MLKIIHLDRAMRYAAWMERANDPHVLRSPKPAPAAEDTPTAKSDEPLATSLTPPKKRIQQPRLK